MADGAVARRLQPARALVLELVEGPTLADRIRRPEGLRLPGEGSGRLPGEGSGRPSGLPVDEALAIAMQIAGALEAAHERGPAWAAGTPTKLLNEGYFTVPGGNPGRTYDISPNGQRFLMVKASGGASGQAGAPQIVVVQNWLEELKRLVPVD
jgi:hypothetical protein